MARITHYATVTPFGTRPVLSVEQVMAALDIASRRDLPATYGRFWAVRKEAA